RALRQICRQMGHQGAAGGSAVLRQLGQRRGAHRLAPRRDAGPDQGIRVQGRHDLQSEGSEDRYASGRDCRSEKAAALTAGEGRCLGPSFESAAVGTSPVPKRFMRRASFIAWVRVETPSLMKMFFRYHFTVSTLMERVRAISLFERP